MTDENQIETTEAPSPPKTPSRKKAARAKAARTKVDPSAAPSALLKARSVVQKVLKKEDPSVDVDPAQLTRSLAHIPTNSIALDYLIGGMLNRYGVPPCPGWPCGKISQIYGHESSGKTTVALEAAAGVCAAGGSVCFIDWEHAIDLTYAQGLGVPTDDPSRFYLAQPLTLESGMKILWTMAAAGIDLIILDSIGAGVPEEIFNQSLEKQGDLGRVGLLAAKWSRFLPKVHALITKTGSHVMGLSQLRMKINTSGYGGDPTTQQGGEAWKFYSSIRMKFRKIKSEKGKVYDGIENKMVEKVLGTHIKAKVDKSKVSPSQQHEGTFWVVFGEGIDDLRTVIEICLNHGVVSKGGAWYSYTQRDGTLVKECGLPAFQKYLNDNPDIIEELTMEAITKLRSGEPLQMASEDEEGIDLDAIMAGNAEDVDLDAIMDGDDDDDDDDTEMPEV